MQANREITPFDKLGANGNGTAAPVVKWNALGALADSAGPPAGEGTAVMAGSGQPSGTPMAKGSSVAAFVLSTDDVDRHGDVVSADGWRLEAYLRNPVLLWAHDYRHPAIGRAVSVWNEPHRLLAKMEFAPSAFAQEVAALYEYGFQWGVSVGFRPIRWEERRDPRSGAFLGLRYLEQELLEVSAVPVPANRQALRRGASPPPHSCPSEVGIGREATSAIPWQSVALGALLAELEAARG